MNKRFRLMDENGDWSAWVENENLADYVKKNIWYKAIETQEEMTKEEYERIYGKIR